MIIELEMLQAKLAQFPDFPPELKILVEHLIISHHGEYEFGSPKLPMFPEALMLHYLDNLDSKMESMRAHFERETTSEGPWTGYNSSLSRPLLNSSKFLEKKRPVVAAAESSAASDANNSFADEVASPEAELPGAETTPEAVPVSTREEKT
jgi:3'-5' exoribonuclease